MLSIIVAAITLSLPSLCLGQASDGVANVTTAFFTAKIVPKIIQSFTPSETLNISFTDSATAENVAANTGSVLTIAQTADEPHFALGDGSSPQGLLISVNRSYVIVMFDPDAPTPQMPNVSQILHFIGGNFTTDSSGTLSNSSAALVEYLSPAPPVGSDPHRYIVLVYNQPNDFDTVGPMFGNSSTSRLNFSVSDFARSTKLQSPIAGNFFLEGPSSSSNSSSGSAPAGGLSAAPANSTGILNSTVSGTPSAAVPEVTASTSASPPASTSAAISGKVNAPLTTLVSAVSAIIFIITISM